MAKKNYYAVRRGLTPGIYLSWDEAKVQVNGYKGAQYKGFATKEEAIEYMQGVNNQTPSKELYSLIDRRFEPDTSEEYFEVHSDGGARGGNPGYGGYGYVVVDCNHNIVEEGYGYGQNMTNNQAELLGAIEGIKAVKEGAKVYFITDSTYVYAGFAKDFPDQPRYEKWEKKGWKDVKNLELVQELYELGKAHRLECIPRPYRQGERQYIPFAHGDKPDERGCYKNPYNKICDRLANIGIVDAVNQKTQKNGLVQLIHGSKIVKEVPDAEFLEGEVVHIEQTAPFYVTDLDERRYGRVVDVNGISAKVN
ncbi:ribonuclease H family protein [Eubacterium oxidoreducens]|uniref:ribonuclease H n=1 Tax=Eubacterium oxidoreducens TaxID=1732 RepID=A0A1G6BV46_EUBOX|nr:ribonuclease H family protein [Eubacterium oxidoreducens]SDB24489.1 RNase H [Eubacterium oxidoreducens]